MFPGVYIVVFKKKLIIYLYLFGLTNFRTHYLLSKWFNYNL